MNVDHLSVYLYQAPSFTSVRWPLDLDRLQVCKISDEAAAEG